MESNYEYVLLYPAQIKTDAGYQREIDANRVARIVKDWNDNLVNAPKVSLRADGNYYVFNGQHTLTAWQKKYGNRPIQCKVFRGLTEVEEKDLFVKQEGYSAAVRSFDKLRAEYNAGTFDVVDMVNCCKLVGLEIRFDVRWRGSSKFATVNAVSSSYSAYKTLGHDNFINMLETLNDSFFGDKVAFQDGFIKGMTYLFREFGDKFNKKDMVSALRRNPAGYYDQKAKQLTGPMQKRYAAAFADQYNKKRRESNKLIVNL